MSRFTRRHPRFSSTWCAIALIAAVLAAAGIAPPAPVRGADATPGCVAPKKLGVVFVLDDSGSMYNPFTEGGVSYPPSDPGFLRATATRLGLDQLADGYVAGAVAFWESSTDIFPPTELGASTRQELKDRVQSSLRVRGGTNFDAAFRAAKRQLDAMPATVDRKAVVFLSDGRSSPYSADVPIAVAGIPIFTFGLGAANDAEMTAIASRSAGAYFKLTGATDIPAAFGQVIARIACDIPTIDQQTTLAPGQSVEFPFLVAPDDLEFRGVATWAGGAVSAKLTRPNRTDITPTAKSFDDTFNLSASDLIFATKSPRAGVWRLTLTAQAQNVQNVAVDLKLYKRNEYVDDGGPDPNPAVGCEHTLAFGPIDVIASCLRKVGDGYVAEGKIRLNGLDFTPEGTAAIKIEPKELRVSATGKVRVAIGPVTLYSGPFNWKLSGELSFKVGGAAKIKGLPLKGDVSARWVPAGTSVSAHVSLGPSFGEITGDITLKSDNKVGFTLDNIQISLAGSDAKLFGRLPLKQASIGYTAASDTWEGGATIGLPVGRELAGKLAIQNGGFKSASAEGKNLNWPIGQVVVFQDLGFGVEANPFALTGSLGLTGGPELVVLGNKLSAVKINGNFRYEDGKDQSTWTVGGDFALAGSKSGQGQVVYRPGLDVEFSGGLDFTIKGFGIRGTTTGWVENLDRFQADAEGEVVAFDKAIAGGNGRLSSIGVGACGQFTFFRVTIETGGSYKWGDDGPRLVVGSCGFSDLEVQRSSSGRAITNALGDVVLRGGLPKVALAVHGAGAAPAVNVTGPGGITLASDPSGFAQFPNGLVIRSDTEATTYVVLARPPAGTWNVTAQPGSAGVSRIGIVNALPTPRVRARVTRDRRGYVLSWRLRPLRGQTVSFVERANGIARTIVTTSKASGRVRFVPRFGPGGRRAVVALVDQYRIPRTGLSVARFRVASPARPRAVTNVRVARARRSSRVVWRHAGGSRGYEVRMVLRDGRRLLKIVGAGARSARFPTVGRRAKGRVTVVALGFGRRTSHVVRVTLK